MNKNTSQRMHAKAYNKHNSDTIVDICKTLTDVKINLGKHPLILMDKEVAKDMEIARLTKQVEKKHGKVIELHGGEAIKEHEFFLNLKKQLTDVIHDVIIIIGGGTVINLGLYLVNALNLKNNLSPIIIPTNTMAIADVAIGSLGLLNINGVKNKLKVICDPAQVIVSKNLYENSPLAIRTDGMIESVKHALFQDSTILRNATEAYLGKGNESKYFDLATHTMELKIKLQNSIIEGNESLRALLTYGHLHAHILEEYFEYTIPHSLAVYIGLLIDLELAGPQDTYSYLLGSLKETIISNKLGKLLSKIELKQLESLYMNTNKHRNIKGDFLLVSLPKLGCYGNLKSTVELKEIGFAKIAKAYAKLNSVI